MKKPTHPASPSGTGEARTGGHFVPYALPGHYWETQDYSRTFPRSRTVRKAGPLVLYREPSETQWRRTVRKPQPWKSPDGPDGETFSDYYVRHMKRDLGWEVRSAAAGDPSALEILADNIEMDLDALASLAHEGNRRAAVRLAEILRYSVRELSYLVKRDPETFRELAGSSLIWPVITSPNPKLSDKADVLIREIGLGSATGLALDVRSKWPDSFVTQIALDLLEYIPALRRRRTRGIASSGFLSDWNASPDDIAALGYTEALKLVDGPIPDRPFDRQNADAWWEVAKAVLLASYPKPERISELAELERAPSRRKSPGRLRANILDRVRRRFLSLSP